MIKSALQKQNFSVAGRAFEGHFNTPRPDQLMWQSLCIACTALERCREPQKEEL